MDSLLDLARETGNEPELNWQVSSSYLLVSSEQPHTRSELSPNEANEIRQKVILSKVFLLASDGWPGHPETEPEQ